LPQSADGSGYTAAEPYPLTNSKTQSYYFVKFSAKCGFYRLNYEGPNIPWQQVRSTATDGECNKSEPERGILSSPIAAIRVLEGNPQLASKQGSFSGADIILSTIEVDGFGELWLWARIIVDP
jgi:dipeptidyl aminopeptidase